jgi:hypothetical protein
LPVQIAKQTDQDSEPKHSMHHAGNDVGDQQRAGDSDLPAV